MSQSGKFGLGVPSPITVPDGGTGVVSITDHALIVGSGTSPITVLAAATDGQIAIGSTGADPVIATITAGTGITVTNGAGTITIDSAGVSQVNIYYVGKHGNDGNSGANINEAKLTFTAALAASSAGDVILCEDGGQYVENLTAVANVTINAQNAVLVGVHTVTTGAAWDFGAIIVNTGTTGITMSTAGQTAFLRTSGMVVLGTGVGVLNTAGKLFFDVASATVENGFLVGNTTSDEMFVRFGEIAISGAGTAFGTLGGGELHTVGGVISDGGTGNGIAFSSSGVGAQEANAVVAHIDIGTLSNITATSVFKLNCALIEGTAAESGAATLIVGGSERIDEVPIGGVTPSTGAFTTLTATTPIGVPSGGTGAATLTDHGILLGSGTSAITPLGVATNGQIVIGSTGADPVLAALASSRDLEITNGAGTIDLTLTENMHTTAMHGWNGAILESPVVDVTSDGATITCSVEKFGGGDLTLVFSDGFHDWDTSPADTVTLTAGSDTSPQINYVYFLNSTDTLTASTVSWPATEHAPLATVLCQSAASLQTYGAYKVHAWTDHIVSSNEMGHIAHLNEWIRSQNATYNSGVAQTLTITPNGGAPDNVIFTTAAGVVLQLHDHVFPAFSGTPDLYTVNDSGTAYNRITDLNALLTDSSGGSMSGRFFSLVIWGVVSEDTGDCKLMVNLPSGTYGTAATLGTDLNKYSDYTIPANFKGTGFLISQLNLRHQVTASGTWTSIEEIDLRGLIPSISAGGSTAFPTEFEDNTFRILDEGDNTKELAFQISGITTGTTRTITMDDRDIDMDAVATTVSTDSGSAVPAAGTLTIAGGTNLNSSGAGSTATINLDAAITSMTSVDFATGGRLGTATSAGNTTLLQAYDVDGTAYVTFATLTANNTPTMDLDDAVTKAGNYIYRAGGTDVPVTDGGTGTSSLTDHGVLVGSGTGAVTPLSVGTDGQVILGSTGADPVFATLASSGSTIAFTTGAGTLNLETGTAVAISAPTDSGTATPSSGALTFTGGDNIDTSGAGSTVTIAVSSAVCDSAATDSGTATPAAGVLTIAGGTDITTSGAGSTVTVTYSGTGGISWSEVTGTTQAMAVDTGYIANNAGLVTLTLPDTAAVGDIVAIAGSGAGMWKLAQNAGETVHFISSDTTTGVGGSLAATVRYDSVELVCITANTDWVVRSVVGNLTIV